MATAFDLVRTGTDLALRGLLAFDDDEAMARWEAELAAFDGDARSKTLARRHVSGTLRVQAQHAKDLAKALVERAARAEAAADCVDEGTRALVEAHAEATGQERMPLPDGGWAKVQRRISQVVVIDDEAQLPASAWRVKREPAKPEIKAALEAGREVPGAHLEPSQSSWLAWSK